MEEKKVLTKEELNNSTIIKNFSYNQKEILYNIMQLHNNGEPYDCDITASTLKFYNGNKSDEFYIPEPKYLFDVQPQFDRVQKITPFEKLPFNDGEIGSIVIDLPFVISPKTSKSTKEANKRSLIIQSRFASFYPVKELYENEYWWLKEAYRVLKPNGICVFKMQSVISGGLEIWSTPFAFMCAQKIGFNVLDEFILGSKVRLIAASRYKSQQHARKYTSTFWVFEKNDKKAKKTNLFSILDDCETQNLEGKIWPYK